MKIITSTILLAIFSTYTFGQTTTNIDSVNRHFESFLSTHQPLKIYTHLNKDIFLAGETILGKSYIYDAAYNTPDSTNNIVYTSLRDSTGNEISSGISTIIENRGQISVPLSDQLATGYYHLVSYTKWQLNENSGIPYSKEIFVINLNTPLYKPDKTTSSINAASKKESEYTIEVQNNIAKRIIVGIGKKNNTSNESLQGIIHSNGIIEAHFPVTIKGNSKHVASILRQDLRNGVHEIILLKDQQIVSKQLFVSENQPESPAVLLTTNTDSLTPRGTLKLQLSYAEQGGQVSNLSISINSPNWLYNSSNISSYTNIESNLKPNSGASLDNSELVNFSSSIAINTKPSDPTTKPYPKELYGFSLSGNITPPTNRETTVFLSSPYTSTSTYYQKVNGSSFTFSNLKFTKTPMLMLSLDHPDKHNLTLNQPLGKYAFKAHASQEEPTADQLNTLKRLGLQNRLIADSYGLNKDLQQTPPPLNTKFHFNPDISVDVTKYIYLNDLKEIIDEIIPAVRLVKKKEAYELNLYVESKTSFQNDPQIFVDMIPINDINQIVHLPSSKISKVEVIKEVVTVGDLKMNGVLAIFTKQGDLGGISTYNTMVIDNLGLNPINNFSENFNSTKDWPSRTPYMPSNTYWNPSLTLKNNTTKVLEVTLPDSPGNYTILVEGITSTGRPIHIKKSIKVSGHL